MMAPSPLQRVRVRTPSHLALTPNCLTPSVQKFRVGSASSFTPVKLVVGPDSQCRTPLPVYRRVCSEYFRGLCKSKNCLESHDPGLVSRCIQFAAEGHCNEGDKCWLRHDRPNQLDQRPLFDLNKYREFHNQKADELRQKLQEEDQRYRDEKRALYERDVYTHAPLGDSYKVMTFEEAMTHLKLIQEEYFKKAEKPLPVVEAPAIHIVRTDSAGEEDDGIYSDEESFDIDIESYFSKLTSWLNNSNITSWTARQVHNFYEEATTNVGGQVHYYAEFINHIFRAFQPGFETWAEVFNMINMEMSELVDTMHEWMKLPGITELHVGGLYAGLLRIKSKKWNLEKLSKLLMNSIAVSQVSIGIICMSNRIPDGYFLLGLCKYGDIDTSSKLFKFYLKSKEEKIEAECCCDDFVCSCPAIVEWDLYGISLFRPMFDYLDWDISRKAELFSKSTEGFWTELEIKAVLEHILTDASDKEYVLNHCKSKESSRYILKHLMLSGSFVDMPALNTLLNESLEMTEKSKETQNTGDKVLIPCKGIETDIDGSVSKHCRGYSVMQCEKQLCGACCMETLGCLCAAHMSEMRGAEEGGNAFCQLICTETDEEWDYATFHGISPAMTYDSVQEFEESVSGLGADGADGERMKKVEFSCAAEVTDSTVLRLTQTFGEALQVVELQTILPGDFCKIKDASVDVIVERCPHLVKLRLVGCTEISSDAFIKIAHGCKKLQSLEVSGVAKFSGFLKDRCLEPLFGGALPELHFLNLLDQFFLHSATIERLRRKRRALKLIIGERDSGDMDGDVLENMRDKAAHNQFTSEENFTEEY